MPLRAHYKRVDDLVNSLMVAPVRTAWYHSLWACLPHGSAGKYPPNWAVVYWLREWYPLWLSDSVFSHRWCLSSRYPLARAWASPPRGRRTSPPHSLPAKRWAGRRAKRLIRSRQPIRGCSSRTCGNWLGGVIRHHLGMTDWPMTKRSSSSVRIALFKRAAFDQISGRYPKT